MIRLVLFLLVFAGTIIDPTRISKINALKKEAKEAYNSADYKTAIAKYKELNEKYDVHEDEIQLNLANGYFLSKDTANAISTFQPLTNSANKEIASKAHQQLGVIASQQKKYDQALSDFKQAIKTDPGNESARYNYELLKKQIEENKKKQDQNKDQQNKDQKDKKDQQNKDQNKDQKDQKNDKKDDQKKNDDQKKDQDKKDQDKKDQDKKDQEDKNKQDQKKDEQKEKDQQQQDQDKQEQKDKQEPKSQNFDQNKIPQVSKQKAEMILEAMKNQEKQYLQQQKRKATKSRDRNKPDW